MRQGTDLGLLVERDVGHLLAGVEQRVLGGLGEDVLRCADEDCRKEGGEPQPCDPGGKDVASEDEAEEGKACSSAAHSLRWQLWCAPVRRVLYAGGQLPSKKCKLQRWAK